MPDAQVHGLNPTKKSSRPLGQDSQAQDSTIETAVTRVTTLYNLQNFFMLVGMEEPRTMAKSSKNMGDR